MRIVINRSDAIGDLVLTIPVIEKIKSHYPEAIVVLIIAPKCAEFVNNLKSIDEYWVLNNKETWTKKYKSLFQKMKDFKPSHFFHIGGPFLPALVAKRLKIEFRGGLVSKSLSFLLLNQGVRQKRSDILLHESEANLFLLKPMGLELGPSDRSKYAPLINEQVFNDVEFSEKHNQELEEIFKDRKDQPFIIIHPGMTGHTLNWSPRLYAKLLKRLEIKYKGKLNFIVSYTDSDKLYLDEFKEEMRGENRESIWYYNGAKDGLGYYMKTMTKAKLFIGGSTGPTHLANILQVPLVGIYSPIRAQSSFRWGPLLRNDKTKVIVPDVVCGEKSKCAGTSCQFFECMLKIQVDDVLMEVEKILNKAG